jgi:hypothetical protein
MAKATDHKPTAEQWCRDALVARIDTHGSVEDAKRALLADLENGLPYTYRNADGVRVAGDPRFWHELWAEIEPFENRAFIGDPVSSTSDPPYPPSDLPSAMREIKVQCVPVGVARKPGPGLDRELYIATAKDVIDREGCPDQLQVLVQKTLDLVPKGTKRPSQKSSWLANLLSPLWNERR